MSCNLEQTPTTQGENAPAADLLKQAGAFTRDNDDAGLLRYLQHEWAPWELADLLDGDDSVVAWVAAYCLGAMGGPAAAAPLIRALQHEDSAVASSAEDALWRISFDRAGVPMRRKLMQAADLAAQGRPEAAIATLDDIIEREPGFAEAYNQRAIVRYLMDDLIGSIADAKRAVKLDASHFGALASMGHAHAEPGQLQEALVCYRRALEIQPRMEGLRESIEKIQAVQHRRPIVLCVD